MSPDRFYLFNSRIATHVVFWIAYYIFFSLIWATGQGLKASFFLEFILLPIRIMAVYVTIYVLLPKFLVERQYIKFILGYGGLILFSAILQRIFIHFFYESLILNNPSEELFSFKMLLRAMILINTTVFLILSFKIFQLFQIEKRKNEVETAMYIELKADRRFYRINTNEILFIQGKGNYTTYHLQGGSKITTYGTIKKALEELPANFIRIHKSYIANKAEIRSFDTNSIEIKDQFIPRGKSITDEELL